MSKQSSYKFIFNQRLLFVLLLGFSSGLPLALTSSTLAAWFSKSTVSIASIGLISLIGQPYVYKFLWAPIMDRFTPPFLGRRRGWMLICQTLLIITISAMSFFNPNDHALVLGIVAFVVAFLSASQDITIDAYRTDLLEEQERGMGAAFAVAGYRIAMVASGGLALILAGVIGWQETYLFMAVLMLVGVFASLFGPEPTYQDNPPQNFHDCVILPLQDLLMRNKGLQILLFIVLYKLSYEFVLALTPAFLLRHIGFTLVEVGTINKGLGLLALLVGLFIGGLSLIRLGTIRALFIFGFLQALGSLGYLIIADAGRNLSLLAAVISFENFAAGLEASAFVAFLMSLCNHRFTALQFALLSALATIGRIIAGPIGASIITHYHWPHFYVWCFLISIPSFALLWWLKDDLQDQSIVSGALS